MICRSRGFHLSDFSLVFVVTLLPTLESCRKCARGASNSSIVVAVPVYQFPEPEQSILGLRLLLLRRSRNCKRERFSLKRVRRGFLKQLRNGWLQRLSPEGALVEEKKQDDKKWKRSFSSDRCYPTACYCC